MGEQESPVHQQEESPEQAAAGTPDTRSRLPYRPRPCGSCPWRRDVHDRWVYGNLAEYAAGTVGQAGAEAPLGAPMFACHKSKTEPHELCAGWLVVAGLDHLTVRLALAWGLLPASVLAPGAGWPELFSTYEEMASTQADRLTFKDG